MRRPSGAIGTSMWHSARSAASTSGRIGSNMGPKSKALPVSAPYRAARSLTGMWSSTSPLKVKVTGSDGAAGADVAVAVCSDGVGSEVVVDPVVVGAAVVEVARLDPSAPEQPATVAASISETARCPAPTAARDRIESAESRWFRLERCRGR